MGRFRVGDVAPTLFLWNGLPVNMLLQQPDDWRHDATGAMGPIKAGGRIGKKLAVGQAMPVDGNQNGIERGGLFRRICFGGTQ